jgi:hypothetical protein
MTGEDIVFGRDDLLALQARCGRSIKDLTALSANDPFATGAPEHVEKAEWIVGLINEYGVDLNRHQRHLHYVLLSHGAARPDGITYGDRGKCDSDYLSNVLDFARELRMLPLGAFPDKKAALVADYEYLRSPVEPSCSLTPPTAYIPGLPAASLTPWQLEELDRPTRLQAQPLTIEIVTEKEGIVPEVEPLAREFGCRLIVTTGATGKGVAYSIVRRTIVDGRPRVVLFLNDADSAGEGMPVALGRHIEWHTRKAQLEGDDVPEIYQLPVALTLEQVRGIEMEIGREIPRVNDDDRASGRVELDALEVFVPGWLARELRAVLDAVHASVTYRPVDDVVRDVEAEAAEVIAPVQAEMAALVDEANRLLGTPEAVALREKLDEIREEVWELESEAEDALAEVDDELPLPDVYGPDMDAVDWLLDTGRGYVEQLAAYRRFEPEHRRRDPLVLEERAGCVGCGGNMFGEPLRAKRCSGCRSK